MRLWTIDPSQLDAKGLVALWREGLLAQAVLLGQTKGYKNHPQLDRWRGNLNALGTYLFIVYLEACHRSYDFDLSKIEDFTKGLNPILVTSGQIDYEVKLLQSKLDKRSPSMVVSRKINPIFREIVGPVEYWEKVKEI